MRRGAATRATNPELSDINPAYWPCDPASGGNLSAGTACWASVGAPQGGNFNLGLKTTNTNGASPAYFSPNIAVLAPSVSIVGFTGNVLQILAGNPNNGDASASQGNTAEANFAWTFTCTPACGALTGTVVTVPTSATAFSLIATYKDGYQVTKTGSIQQVDLVPNLSVSPNPVLKSTTLTAKNLMQKAAAATLNSVAWRSRRAAGAARSGRAFLSGERHGRRDGSVHDRQLQHEPDLQLHRPQRRAAVRAGAEAFPVTDFVPVPVLGVYKGANKHAARDSVLRRRLQPDDEHGVLPLG